MHLQTNLFLAPKQGTPFANCNTSCSHPVGRVVLFSALFQACHYPAILLLISRRHAFPDRRSVFLEVHSSLPHTLTLLVLKGTWVQVLRQI